MTRGHRVTLKELAQVSGTHTRLGWVEVVCRLSGLKRPTVARLALRRRRTGRGTPPKQVNGQADLWPNTKAPTHPSQWGALNVAVRGWVESHSACQ